MADGCSAWFRRVNTLTTVTLRHSATAEKISKPSKERGKAASIGQMEVLAPTPAPVRPVTARPKRESMFRAKDSGRGAAENT